jgi:UDP-N-acetylglucosamine 2-epimerase (non-hydrolysing)
VKAGPLCTEIRKEHQEILVHTGQHYDRELSEVFFGDLGIPEPDYNLEVGSSTHGRQTALVLERVEEVIIREKPDLVVVYGDTNSTVAGALAAVKLGIPVAHVEAGPRTYDRSMPEEVNRVVTDHISELLFCPTERSVAFLAAEGVTEGVYLVGNIMRDALETYLPIAESNSQILDELDLAPGEYYLATIHRPDNADCQEKLAAIMSAFESFDRKVVFPVHPRTQNTLRKIGCAGAGGESNILLEKPVRYTDMLVLERHARAIVTDSGGIQNEAMWLRVPCVTIYHVSGWPETVESGWNRLARAERKDILNAVDTALVAKTSVACRPGGDEKVARKICGIMTSFLDPD